MDVLVSKNLVQRNLGVFTFFVKKNNNEYEENIIGFSSFISSLSQEMTKIVLVRYKIDLDTLQEN